MKTPRRAAATTLAVTGLLLTSALVPALAASGGAGLASTAASSSITSTGLRTGQVKHVWLIILENKSYDMTFTGLNKNSYLWQTLPSQGALLKSYYGTGHYSMDNYLTLVSGQAPTVDVQEDCDVADTNLGSESSIVTHHTGKPFGRTDTYGQVAS
ncbi:MAG TPA: phosphoesterase, partial [Friedmanniella sp.]